MTQGMYDRMDEAFRPRTYRAAEQRPTEHRPHEPATPPRRPDDTGASTPSSTTAVSQADGSP
jgi:hypothetical protein